MNLRGVVLISFPQRGAGCGGKFGCEVALAERRNRGNRWKFVSCGKIRGGGAIRVLLGVAVVLSWIGIGAAPGA